MPMLQRKEDARGTVGEGAGLLVGFHVLWLMFIWTYSRVRLYQSDRNFHAEILFQISFTAPGWAPKVCLREIHSLQY